MKLESKENSLNIIKIFCKGHIANIIFNGKILKAFLLRSRKRFLVTGLRSILFLSGNFDAWIVV